jgi:hypothetical protein
MTRILLATTLAFFTCGALSYAQNPPLPEKSGLGDLEALTFSCPKAALNAAARKAADAPSQGTYQFSYFAIVNDSHHAMYEVHFTSNYAGEPDLKYCVRMYCQQGWDPKTAKTEVTLLDSKRASTAGATRGGACHVMTPATQRTVIPTR